ncbi:MAG: hypothetical protein JWR90_692 [Marmoricola sp.]|nr:hypothetical protein [Marmoricola sp.]
MVASDPDILFLPSQGDLRYQWVCARLPALPEDEMRELVVDAWRMCVPAMLHDLADRPTPRPPTEVEVRDGRLYRWIRGRDDAPGRAMARTVAP